VIEDHLFFTGLNILLAWSVYIILMSGTMSFGNGAFMAVGAYIAGICTVKLGLAFEPAIAAAGAFCFVFGIAVGFPALRTRGLYLIMVTIGLAFCVRVAIENTPYLGGVRGLRGLVGTSPWHVAAVLVVAGLLIWIVSRSPLQRILDAVREDEDVAGALGINVVYVQLVAFASGAALAGVAGGMYGHYMLFIAPDHFGILISIFVVLYVILGGVNNMWGPVLGAVLMTLVPEFVRFVADWRTMIFSMLIILLLLVRPEGLLAFRTVSARAPRAKPRS
jgi:branched-chain amino acid transport system permease protein